MAPTSLPMALAVLVLLPFDIVSTVLRFYVRSQRRALGADDWAMLVNIPFWLVSVISTLGMAWSGIGAYDATLSPEQQATALRWFYIFQEPWCFTLITIKWSIGFALIRIAKGNKIIERIVYACMGTTLFVMGGTGMYLFFQCMPIEKNWHPLVPGVCQPRSIQTTLSYAVAAVSIVSDWIFAILPIFLLWNIQMDPRVKASVVGLLGLGIFASIAPIIRLKFLIGMNDETRFLQNLGSILAWASTEMNVGMLVANMPACRPLLEQAIHRFSSWTTGSSNAASRKGKTGVTDDTGVTGKKYLELDERPDSKHLKSFLTGGGTKHGPGVETRIYGRDLDDSSSVSLERDRDAGSQEHIVESGRGRRGTMRVNVQNEVHVEVRNCTGDERV